MSHLKYDSSTPAGQWASSNFGYRQAVRVGDRIECSGQGGWKFPEEGPVDLPSTFPKDLKEEIAVAFKNVDDVLKAAGGKGWPQVFRVNSYHTDITEEVTLTMIENFKKWMPDHQPIWTQIGVAKLGVEGMNVEIEVLAHDAEGAAAAQK